MKLFSDQIWGFWPDPDTTGREVLNFTARSAPGWALRWSRDGNIIFTSTYGDKPVIEWRVADRPLDELLAWVKDNRYLRPLTCEERSQYNIEPLCPKQ